jgi:tetratricopeptide (TPR) repeat protein
MESAGYRGQEVPDGRIRELRREIDRYRQVVDQKVKANGQLGTCYKMLAVRYMDRQMFGEAYRSLQEALAVYPENPVLFQLAGVCAARMGQAQVEEGERERWMGTADALYRRAVELDPGYRDALYGLAVLLLFERDRPEEAGELADRILQRQTQDIDALFLKGQVEYRRGNLEEAVTIYDRIIQLSRSAERREQALGNKRQIEEELYGRR